MRPILIRFLIGGGVVSVFAVMGDVLKPKSFAGLFGAAPSVALATLALTVATEGALYAAIEARSMMAGAVAFFVYASFVSWILMRYQRKALWVTIASFPLWLGVAFGLWYLGLKA
jgi:predicted benzoate:H+ symporter BenE